MAVGYMGRSGASMANYHASRSDGRLEDGVTPLEPGEDPLLAIDPATRDAIVNWESSQASAEMTGPSFGDRIAGGLAGAAVGGVAGFLLLNGIGTRRYRAHAAGPMNAQASLAWAGIGAAIGAISGFARGRNPLESDPRERVAQVVGASPGPAATAPVAVASHPAFASLHD